MTNDVNTLISALGADDIARHCAGLGALLHRAAALGRTLLTLDTRTGDKAEPLYASLGYRTVGVFPGFCRDTVDAGRLDSTTIMYKAI
jgi:hypothetical protein